MGITYFLVKIFDEAMVYGFRPKRFVHFQTQPWDEAEGSGIERFSNVPHMICDISHGPMRQTHQLELLESSRRQIRSLYCKL